MNAGYELDKAVAMAELAGETGRRCWRKCSGGEN